MSQEADAIEQRSAEVEEKVARVRALLQAEGLEGLLLTRQHLVAWITGGLGDIIVRTHERGLVWAVVLQDRLILITQNVEAPRIREEERPDALGFDLLECHWWEDGGFERVVSELCDTARLGTDGHPLGRDLSAELVDLRLPLTVQERKRIRLLGSEACSALEDGLRAARPGISEARLAAEVAARLEERLILPAVLLVGSDKRQFTYRHPTITQATVDRHALVVLVAVRNGLHVALSRTISFGPPPQVLAERHHGVVRVEAAMIDATRPGRTYGEALQAGVDAYERQGYPDEWIRHYQGAAIAYDTREFDSVPSSEANGTSHKVAVDHCVAWNPTIQGAKSEDTFIVESDRQTVVTNTGSWPQIAVDVRQASISRPDILVL